MDDALRSLLRSVLPPSVTAIRAFLRGSSAATELNGLLEVRAAHRCPHLALPIYSACGVIVAHCFLFVIATDGGPFCSLRVSCLCSSLPILLCNCLKWCCPLVSRMAFSLVPHPSCHNRWCIFHACLCSLLLPNAFLAHSCIHYCLL